jgi:cyanophycinase
MIPKGKLLIIGGHEDKGTPIGESLNIHKRNKSQTHFEILGCLIQKIPRAHHIIEIIASASSIPREMEELYINSYKKEGFTHVGIIKVENENDAADPLLIKRIQNSHAVFFTGGDQARLILLFRNSPLLAAIKRKYYSDKNFITGGTSAGAMAIPGTVITGGVISEVIYKEDIGIGEGFDLISHVIIDTHFINRGRFPRLVHAVALNPCCIGIGLGEDTALIISNGNTANCIGNGMVIIIDGSKIKNSNISTADDITPVFLENLVVNILVEGSSYKLKDV